MTNFLKASLFIPVLCLVLSACGGDQGIEAPVLPPPVPAESTDPLTDPDFAIVRGNYFLLESNCPHDATAVRIAQEQAELFLLGGFDFGGEDAVLKGFVVDETGLIRFYGDAANGSAICAAQVDAPFMRGACSYADGLETRQCRFEYSKLVEGTYDVVWNDCQSDDSEALQVQQTDNEVILLNGFDFMTPPEVDRHSGVIEAGEIHFNIEIINDSLTFREPTDPEQFNCDAIVSGDLLTGRCRDLTMTPATICTFGYENLLRTIKVDLTDDARFPSPAITPNPIPVTLTNMAGTYTPMANDCDNDAGLIQVSQQGSTLGLVGGFDYQTRSPDLYTGTVNSASAFSFSVIGSSTTPGAAQRAFCSSNLTFNAFGISGFEGSCDVVNTSGVTVDTCAFTYSRTTSGS